MRVRRVWTLAIASLVGACGGGGGNGGVGPGDPVFTTLAINPSSVSLIVGQSQTLIAIARDQNGNSMSGLSVTYQSNNTATATVSSSGVVSGVAVGTTTIRATGTIGGVTKTADATVSVSATAPQSAAVTASAASTFDPASVTIVRTGSVQWTFNLEHNVTFATTTGAPANIPNTATGSVSRTFPTAGTFNYQCTLHAGMNGTVVVVP